MVNTPEQDDALDSRRTEPSDIRVQPRNRLKGWLWISSGAVLLVGFMATAIHFGLLPGIGGLINSLWGLFIGLSLLLIRYGLKFIASDAVSLLEKDKRPPVLYLRPFSEDKKFPPQKGLALLRSKRAIKLQGWTPASYEEQVALALKYVGPFIAIGNPKEKSPELGASRMYVNVDDWQRPVKQLIRTAGLIFMQVGESEGFLWELEQVIKTVEPDRLILGLPLLGKGGEKARRLQYEKFRSKSLVVFPREIPEKIGDAQFLYFEDDWLPQLFIPSKSLKLPENPATEKSESLLQLSALKGLQLEFMIVSTPYWFRWLLIMAVLSAPFLLFMLAVFIEYLIKG